MSDKENLDPVIKSHTSKSQRSARSTKKSARGEVILREPSKRSASRKTVPKTPFRRWTEPEDDRLIEAIQKNLDGDENIDQIPWRKVSTEMENRTSTACKMRCQRKTFQQRLHNIPGAKNLILPSDKIVYPPQSKKKKFKVATKHHPQGETTPCHPLQSKVDLYDSPLGMIDMEKEVGITFLNCTPMDFRTANPKWTIGESNFLTSLLCENTDDDEVCPPTQFHQVKCTPIRRGIYGRFGENIRCTPNTLSLPLIPTPNYDKTSLSSYLDKIPPGDVLRGVFLDQASQIGFPPTPLKRDIVKEQKRKHAQLLPQTPHPSRKRINSRKELDGIPEEPEVSAFPSVEGFDKTPNCLNIEGGRLLKKAPTSTCCSSQDVEYVHVASILQLSSSVMKKAVAKKLPLSTTSCSPPTPSTVPHTKASPDHLSIPHIDPTARTPLTTLDHLLDTSASPSTAQRSDSSSGSPLINLEEFLGTSAASTTMQCSDSTSNTPPFNLEEILGTSAASSTDGRRRISSESPHCNVDEKMSDTSAAIPTSHGSGISIEKPCGTASIEFLGPSYSVISHFTPTDSSRDRHPVHVEFNHGKDLLSPVMKKELFADAGEDKVLDGNVL